MIPITQVNPNNPNRIHPAIGLSNIKFIIAPVRIIRLLLNIVITVLSIFKSNFQDNTLLLLQPLLQTN